MPCSSWRFGKTEYGGPSGHALNPDSATQNSVNTALADTRAWRHRRRTRDLDVYVMLRMLSPDPSQASVLLHAIAAVLELSQSGR